MKESLFSSRVSVREVALDLSRHLEDSYADLEGKDWSRHVFEVLETFSEKSLEIPRKNCFHNHHTGGRGEFLWDFIVLDADHGMVIAAESEQQSENPTERRNLKHDFEKLLYVYTPIRLLVCKTPNRSTAAAVLQELSEYGSGCCAHFNPGSVFLLHFCFWNNEKACTYIWQSAGDPSTSRLETLAFAPVAFNEVA